MTIPAGHASDPVLAYSFTARPAVSNALVAVSTSWPTTVGTRISALGEGAWRLLGLEPTEQPLRTMTDASASGPHSMASSSAWHEPSTSPSRSGTFTRFGVWTQRCSVLLMVLRLGAGAMLGVSLVACGSSSGPAAVSANPSPCVSPYADSGTADVTVAIPDGSSTAGVQVAVGKHLTVGWAECGESGQFESSDPTGTMLRSTDSSSLGKGGPVINVRYLAQTTGTVTIRGTGSKGSNGKIVVTITP